MAAAGRSRLRERSIARRHAVPCERSSAHASAGYCSARPAATCRKWRAAGQDAAVCHGSCPAIPYFETELNMRLLIRAAVPWTQKIESELPPLDCPSLLVRGTDDEAFDGRWRSLCPRLDIKAVTGSHVAILQPPHFQEVVGLIKAAARESGSLAMARGRERHQLRRLGRPANRDQEMRDCDRGPHPDRRRIPKGVPRPGRRTTRTGSLPGIGGPRGNRLALPHRRPQPARFHT